MAYYFSDTDLTDRLETLTDTVIDTSAKRDAKVRTPASAIVDGWFAGSSPFTADPNTPALIRAGAIEIGVAIALRLLSGDPSDSQAQVAWDLAIAIFGVENGRAKVAVPGVDDVTGFEVVDVTRSVLDEDRDERDNRSDLYP